MTKLTWEQRTAIRMNIAAINEALAQLMELLPAEQQVMGSECHDIHSAAGALYHKYVKQDGEANDE